MPKKSFTFSPPARERVGTGEAQAPEIDREILRKTVDDGVRSLENARVVPITRVQPDPVQPRRSMDSDALADLAASIRAEGILQPLWVRYRYEEDDYMIISGERRYRAALLAGLSELPVLIGNVGSTTRFLHQLIENLQREDLNPVDKGQALARLKTVLPGNWQEVADMVGLTRRRVEQLRALPRMPQLLQDAVRTGALAEDHARAIARLPDGVHAAVVMAVQRYHLSTRRTKLLVKRLQDIPGLDVEGTGEQASALRARIDALIDVAATSLTALDAAALEEDKPAPSIRVPRPRGRAVVPVYEKALEFERVLDRMPVLEYQEDRALLTAIFGRIAAKLAAIDPELTGDGS